MTQKPVRVLYLVPSDVQASPAYVAAINAAIQDLQKWYAGQLGGRTFSLFSPGAATVSMMHAANYYLVDSWDKVVADVGSYDFHANRDKYIWALYADLLHACDEPGRLGMGGNGLCILPRQDLDGLCGRPVVDDCGIPQVYPPSRWVGGLGHELGHAFSLPHPPGCGTDDETNCDWDALMYLGVYKYPNCHLTADDKAALLVHPAFAEPDAPTFPGYKEIDFSKQDVDLDFRMYTIGGELKCYVTDNKTGKVIDFTANEGSEWAWHFVARGGKLRPRSYDKVTT